MTPTGKGTRQTQAPPNTRRPASSELPPVLLSGVRQNAAANGRRACSQVNKDKLNDRAAVLEAVLQTVLGKVLATVQETTVLATIRETVPGTALETLFLCPRLKARQGDARSRNEHLAISSKNIGRAQTTTPAKKAQKTGKKQRAGNER